MTMQITADQIVDVEADGSSRHETRPRHAAAALLGLPGVDVDAVIDEVARFSRRGSVVGGRHRRHPLRPVPHRRRAADHRGEDRRRRRAQRADRREPHGQPARALGRSRRDPAALRAHADALGHRLRRDELEHVPGQPVHHRRRRGLLQVRVVRQRRRRDVAQARARAQPRTSSSSACSSARPRSRVWLADGTNHPGQANFRRQFERVADCLRELHDALPDGWELFTEHKPYEPAFYSTRQLRLGLVAAARAGTPGPRAKCLVDLGHHLPNTNIEQVVSPARDGRPARRLPLQRLEVRRRRPHRRLDPARTSSSSWCSSCWSRRRVDARRRAT